MLGAKVARLGTHQHFASQGWSGPCPGCNAIDEEALRAVQDKAAALNAAGACHLAVSLLALAVAASTSKDVAELEQSVPYVKEECNKLKESLRSANQELEVAVRLSRQQLEIRQGHIKQIIMNVSMDFARFCKKCDLEIEEETRISHLCVGCVLTALAGLAMRLSLGHDGGVRDVLAKVFVIYVVGADGGAAIGITILNMERCRTLSVLKEISNKLQMIVLVKLSTDLNKHYWELMDTLEVRSSLSLSHANGRNLPLL